MQEEAWQTKKGVSLSQDTGGELGAGLPADTTLTDTLEHSSSSP